MANTEGPPLSVLCHLALPPSTLTQSMCRACSRFTQYHAEKLIHKEG